MAVRTDFRFTLPKGSNIKGEPGQKIRGVMRLTQVKDLVAIERDDSVNHHNAAFYLVLLARVVTELGQEGMITRSTIARLTPVDFAFLVDYMHQINHQVIKRVPLTCPHCSHQYMGLFHQLGEV
ncbi:MAG: hypothetical protein LBS86_05375 [Treponema sp.]|jgi:hypothetical protein|nr:hypothetical protein [Treponema sp.]